MMNSSLVGYCGFPALASAGFGLENLRNVYRRIWKELEDNLKIFCHQSATPAFDGGYTAFRRDLRNL
jgi:hypothetical protein